MSKYAKKIVVPALIVGATILTGGAAGLLGATPLFGAATWAGAALAGAGLSAISSTLSLVAQKFAKKPSQDMSQAFQRQTTTLDVNALGKWVFGQTDCPLDLVYEDISSADRYINRVIHVASHEIESFGEMHINDELAISAAGSVQSAWSGIVRRFTNLGTEGQSALSMSNSSWPSTAKGAGLAHIGLEWDLTDGREKIAGGIPTRITQVIKGSKVYDPRLDTTVSGGSGTHRADDQTTWEYNDGSTDIGENWALLVAFYLLGWKNNDKLAIGMGVSKDDIDMEQLIAAANVCEQTVDAKKRYKVGGVMVVDGNHQRVLKEFEAAIGGKIAKIGGKWFIWAPNDDLAAPVDTLTDNDLLQDATQIFRPSGPIADRYNIARGRYIEPDLLYQPAYYPEVREESAVTVDGRENVKEQDFSMIQDVSIAERVAREMVRRSRFTGTWQYVTWYTAIRFQPFDILTLNTRDTNNEDVTVRVIDMAFSPEGIVQLTLMEEDSSIYDTSEPLGTPVTQFDPGAFDPTAKKAVSGLAVSQITISGSDGTATDALDVSWDDPGGIVLETQVQYRVDGTSNWFEVSARRIDFDNAIISPVEPSTNYDVRARHITVTGVVGDWSTLSNQLTGSNSLSKTLADFNNQLINPYFEAGDHGWELAGTGWEIIEGASAVPSTTARTGSWLARFSGSTAASLYNNQKVQVEEGDRVLAGAFFRKDTGSSNVDLTAYIRWYDSSDTLISTTVGKDIITSSETWKGSQVVGVAPANTTYARLSVSAINVSFHVTANLSYADGCYMGIANFPVTTESSSAPSGGRDGDIHKKTGSPDEVYVKINGTWTQVS